MALLVQIRILDRHLDPLRLELLLLMHTQSERVAREPDDLLRFDCSGVRKVLRSIVLLASLSDVPPVILLLRRALGVHLVLGAFSLELVELGLLISRKGFTHAERAGTRVIRGLAAKVVGLEVRLVADCVVVLAVVVCLGHAVRLVCEGERKGVVEGSIRALDDEVISDLETELVPI
jgi:hypothetical protein